MGDAGTARPDRGPSTVDARIGRSAPRSNRQAPAAGRMVTTSDRGPGDRTYRWCDPPLEPVHGGHRLAPCAAGRLHPLLGRDLLSAAFPGAGQNADPRYPGVLPSCARKLPATRSDAVAED